MKLYQYSLDYDTVNNTCKLVEKITEAREFENVYISNINSFLNYRDFVYKDDLYKIQDDVYTSLVPAKSEALNAFIDKYHSIKLGLLHDLVETEKILAALKDMKH